MLPRPWLALCLLAACAPPVPAGVTISHGDSARGWLQDGVPLPDEGLGFVRARPGESTRYGTPQLIGALTRAAAAVHRRWGGAPLRVGDLSAPLGGRHPRHRSHRSGRDMDLLFYATDLDGRSVQGRGWVAYDRFGVGVEPAEHGGRVLRLDEARNWELVRTLLLDEEARVQWIFASRGVKARLLRYAAEHEPDPEALFRAAWTIHEPSRGRPHDDHFHVRVACGPTLRALGCVDRGPEWSWWRDAAAKRDRYAPLSDAGLVALLLEEATLAETTLEDATLEETTLQDATLQDATLEDATLAETTLEETTLAQ